MMHKTIALVLALSGSATQARAALAEDAKTVTTAEQTVAAPEPRDALAPMDPLTTIAPEQTHLAPLAVDAMTPQRPAPLPIGKSHAFEPLGGGIEPFYGNIRTFWGDATPFYGNIRTFWGDVDPYGGNLEAFWGNIRTFNDGSGTNTVAPQWGQVEGFWGDLGASWGNIRTFWGNIRTFQDDPADYVTLRDQLSALVSQSQTFWGSAVQAQTGRSFADGFANPLLARYGIDLSDPSSLEHLDAGAREHFFMDWYDGLMEFSGADHADHWMKEINWTPQITQNIGEGRDSIIGLLDFTVTGDGTHNIIHYDGVSDFTNGHGAAVASLMIAAHDGHGVMGLAPMASVVQYNPFDATGTAGWADITTGVRTLASEGASIVNMSLGVPGWTLNPGWNDVFSDPSVAAVDQHVIFVTAAGNNGTVQHQNVAWNFATNPNLIVVGSVDPTGHISSFSNQPGDACLLDNGVCTPGNELMYRFIVAPGEFILVSDGHGGVTRMSGTSFAAPLVSGTIALLHDRWPWLANYPRESVDIILKSARDLGAPGVDPVYGWGELDVAAALSPLDFSNLAWYTYDKGKYQATKLDKVIAQDKQKEWESKGMYYYVFETIGSTYRDFAIPLSSKLVGKSLQTLDGSMQYFQQYLYSRMQTWITGVTPARPGPGGPGPHFGFAGFSTSTAAVANGSGLDIQMAMAPKTRLVGYRQDASPYQTAVRIAAPDQRFALTVGAGDGAVMLGGSSNFGMMSDYDPETGGANPLLGFASGGGYGQVAYALNDRLTVSAGVSQRVLRRDPKQLDPAMLRMLGAVPDDAAQARHVTVTYQPAGGTSLTASYTRLHENSALLGVQSIDPADFREGTNTEGMTLSGTVDLGAGLGLFGSGTMSRTLGGNHDQGITAAPGGVLSSAYEVGFDKSHLVDRRDRIRVTVAQPLHVERGALDLTTVQVVNRQTGELGVRTQRFDLPGTRRDLVGEVMYGRALFGGQAQLSLFGRANLTSGADDAIANVPALMAGSAFRLAL